MKKITLLFVACLLISVNSWAQNKDAILGKWLNSAGEGQIEIFKKGEKVFGKMAWLKEPNADGKPKTDVNNPDDKLKSRPILGMELLTNFEFEDGKWVDGKIYDPRSGKTYSCIMTVKGDKLNVRGFIGVALMGKTEVFTRVK